LASKRQNPAKRANQGVALLTVLWLVAGLSAIALTIANTVRGETERSSTEADGLKAYYLASGAVDRVLLYLERAGTNGGAARNAGSRQPGRGRGNGARSPVSQPTPTANPLLPSVVTPITRFLALDFPTGVADAEIIPETSKLDVNKAPPKDLLNLLVALGEDPNQAEQITAGILEWRGGSPGGSALDQYYLSLTPSFQARHASLQEIEELLLVRGITPDLFYGGYARDAQGRLVPHAGLRDCLSVFGSLTSFDVNTVEPAVMVAIGIPPDTAASIDAFRKTTPIANMGQLAPFRSGGGPLGRLAIQPITIGSRAYALTVRATARLKLPKGQLSDVRRTVSEMVMFLDPDSELLKPGQPSYQVLRWYENAVPLQ
jgi:general secretion pathway protein K